MKVDRKERAYAAIRQDVLALALPPGTMLDEAGLSARFELSRTPLREVLQRLAGEGFVSITANRGASVASMDLATMRCFFQTAPMVYAAVARLATEQATHGQIALLKKVQRQFRKAVEQKQLATMVSANHQFHEHLGNIAANPYLTPSLNRLLIDHTRMSHTFYQAHEHDAEQRIVLACEQHEAMLTAMEQRDPAETVRLTLEHWELSRGEMERYVRPDHLPFQISTEKNAATGPERCDSYAI